jgi:hypothetical protein
MKNKKVLSLAAALSVSVVLIPRPAQAMPKFLENALDIVGSSIGISVSEKLNGYLEIGMGKLDKLLGLDPKNLESITGVMGGIDPIKAGESIDRGSLTESDLAIPKISEDRLKKSEFNTGLSSAIGKSLLTTDGQQSLKDAADGATELTKSNNELAESAQKMNVTQDIAKVQAKQNAQEIQVLNLVSGKQDLQLQQQAATTVSTSVSAAHANAEERRTEETIESENRATTQSSGVGSGIVEGL